MADRWKVMSEYCREQHPLLCEEGQEEELYSPQFYRRIRPKHYQGRVRNNLKGAAAVLTRWPEHWSSFLTYIWLGVGMISLTTFIIYNSLFAFSLLPSVDLKPAHTVATNEIKKTSIKRILLPDIYMHIFDSNKNGDINFEYYMPNIEIVSNTFSEYTFNFIIVSNDTNIEWTSAEDKNELALNALWKKNIIGLPKETRYHNVNIEHVALSALLDNSPLRKFWRILPQQLIEFLVRAVSIWDKGGVALNPDILTSKFQHTFYIEKLQRVLNKYAHTNKSINISKIITTVNKIPKKYRKLNNIRDIIDALERENVATNALSEHTLDEAEDKGIKNLLDDSYDDVKENINNASKAETESINKYLYNTKTSTVAIPSHMDKNMQLISSNDVKSIDAAESGNNITKLSLLPLLFEFFFHNNAFMKPKPLEVSSNRTRKSIVVIPDSEEKTTSMNKNVIKTNSIKTSYKPTILPITIEKTTKINPEIINFIKTLSNNKVEDHMEANRLTIDIKGNIIGTATPCHAFVGTIFSNVIHHSDEETLTDFIIAELTIFCKGLLSTCPGIDLILL